MEKNWVLRARSGHKFFGTADFNSFEYRLRGTGSAEARKGKILLTVNCKTSSIGSLNLKFLRSIYLAAQGMQTWEEEEEEEGGIDLTDRLDRST